VRHKPVGLELSERCWVAPAHSATDAGQVLSSLLIPFYVVCNGQEMVTFLGEQGEKSEGTK